MKKSCRKFPAKHWRPQQYSNYSNIMEDCCFWFCPTHTKRWTMSSKLLSLSKRKTLCEDAEELGGRRLVTLLSICNANNSFYGLAGGTPKRRKFQKNRAHVKHLTPQQPGPSEEVRGQAISRLPSSGPWTASNRWARTSGRGRSRRDRASSLR